ncbi:hypothetical protein JSY36_05130 [Bacillus sp. H-16]|uniref:hypothetical protein n=1 Tax=Alteribacter salitolerans TaxID=2912333 RepID=UPI0019642B2C|nr:hypothetical protein [Alteribacter salitolerans]MBM7095136.1 hypothetical protein [Alteribacter salitolerans]
MKKYMVIVGIIGATVLGACSVDSGGNTAPEGALTEAKLTEASLTDREEAILSGSEDAFVFDFDVDETYSEVTVRMVKYEFGALVDHHVSALSAPVDGEGSIVFTASRLINQEDALFTTSVSSGDSIGTHQTVETILRDGSEGMAKISETHLEPEVPIKGDMVLATIAYSSEDAMSSLPASFYDDPEAYEDVFGDYDIVYVLTSEFR